MSQWVNEPRGQRAKELKSQRANKKQSPKSEYDLPESTKDTRKINFGKFFIVEHWQSRRDAETTRFWQRIEKYREFNEPERWNSQVRHCSVQKSIRTTGQEIVFSRQPISISLVYALEVWNLTWHQLSSRESFIIIRIETDLQLPGITRRNSNASLISMMVDEVVSR